MNRFSSSRIFFSGQSGLLRRPGPVTVAIIIWLAAEFMAFSLVVGKVGMTGALLIGLGTTILGFTALRRLSSDAMANLRRRMESETAAPGNLLDGTLTALGAVFLILPGFVSDVIGLALLSPSVRRWISSVFGGKTDETAPAKPRSTPGVIDLDASDWRQIEEPKRKRRKDANRV